MQEEIEEHQKAGGALRNVCGHATEMIAIFACLNCECVHSF
jgi:hypothetical protein